MQIQESNNYKFCSDYTHTHYKVPNSELLKLNLKLNLNVQLSAKRLDFVNWIGASLHKSFRFQLWKSTDTRTEQRNLRWH